MKRKLRKDNERVVMLGGGHGAHAVISGTKEIYYPEQLASIAPVSDSGGSSGRFREECAAPAYGDIGMHIKAFANLGDVQPELRMLLPYRSVEGEGVFIEHMTWVNYTFHVLYRQHGNNIQMAIDSMRRLFHARSRIYPVCTASDVQLAVELDDSSLLVGEKEIDTRSNLDDRKIVRASLRPRPTIFSGAAEAIRDADKIVICSGDFWTSIIPITLVDGFKDVIRYATKLRTSRSPAQIIMVMNLMTKKNETHGWTSRDFINGMCEYFGVPYIDTVIMNDEPIRQRSLTKYAKECAYPVRWVPTKRALRCLSGPVVHYEDDSVRHDSRKVAELIRAA